jgi:hypothetical protein
MPSRLRPLAIVVLAAWGLSAGWAPAQSQKAASPILPDEARESLKKKWPEWAPAAVATAIDTCRPGGKPAAALVTADFDSDGHADFAAAIQTKAGVRLVVLTWRPWGFDLYDVDSLGDHGLDASVLVAAPGLKFVNPRSGLDDYFSGDTLMTRSCGSGATAYIWTGVGFTRVVIASIDGPRPSAPR